MPTPINPRERYPYVLKRERSLPVEGQTRFFLRPLTCEELASLEDNSVRFNVQTDEMRVQSGTTLIRTLQLGLVGWENFGGAEFKVTTIGGTKTVRTEVTKECLDLLSPADRRELANAITEQNRLTEDDRGN